MASLDFRDVAKLLNYSRTTEIDLDPVKVAPHWSLHLARHKVHASIYKFAVLYVQAAVTLQELEIAGRAIDGLLDTHVVFPPTVHHSVFQRAELRNLYREAKGFWTTKEYITSFIKAELQVYLEKLNALQPKFYVHPRVETPSGIPLKHPNPLRSFLCDPDSASSMLGGKLSILLAEPGQGKTYMSRHLVSSLAEDTSGTVPLIVDSSQWHTLSVQEQGSLSKTIAHSFRHFDATIGWLDGHEDEFLSATLRADVFRIVFDGFDEYILRNGSIQPMEVLEALASLASSTGTRIVITSRTSFWNANLPEKELKSFLERTGSMVYIIQPFDPEQAKQYFTFRLQSEGLIEYATGVYTQLSKENRTLMGRGFVLSLIADLAEKSESTQAFLKPDTNVLMWLVSALCEREVLRQQLPLRPSEQIAILGTFATEVCMGGRADTELLELAIAEVRPTLDAVTIQSTIEKLKSHPLLEFEKQESIWVFKQEQVRILLLADQLIRWGKEEIVRFVARARFDATTRQDIASTIVASIYDKKTYLQAISRLGELCLAMSSHQSQAGKGTDEGRKLAAMIALTAVEQALPRGSSKSERTKVLREICGGDVLCRLHFTGTIARYDFRGVVFDYCRFEGVTWANCQFDENTILKNCLVIGWAQPAHCKDFGSIQIVDSAIDPEAETIVNSIRIREGRKQYTADDLSNEVASVLNKFIIKGGVGLKTVTEENLRKGTIGASRYRDEILEMLLNTILDRHSLSGGMHGIHVREDVSEAVKFFAANNVFTGSLRELVEKLTAKLQLK